MTVTNPRGSRLSAVALAVAAALATLPTTSHAQYRIDNGAVRDASNRIGSGGYNPRSGSGLSPAVTNNLIVTGNVANGRSFRGNLGYSNANDFRANLGSGDFDRFYRDSVGVNQLRGAPTQVYANQGVDTFRPYFGPGQTVTPPTGFVQAPGNGGYVLGRAGAVQPNDGRIDYGGATRSQIANGQLAQQTVIGGAGLASGLSNSTYGGLFDQRDNLSQVDNLSEYTTLSRPAARIGLLEGDNANGVGERITLNPRDPKAAGNDGPDQTDRSTGDAAANRDQRIGLNPAAGNPQAAGGRIDNRSAMPGNAASGGDTDSTTGATAGASKNSSPLLAQPLTAGGNSGASTGQNLQANASSSGNQANPQYAALRARLLQNQTNRATLPGQPSIDAARQQAEQNNLQVLDRRKQAAAPAQSGTKKPDDSLAAKPDTNGTPRSQIVTPQTPTPSEPAATPTPPDRTPVEIKSLTTGITDPTLKETLGQAESMMKAGKFTSAIDAFDRAGRLTKNDGLIFLGRSVAELGGGYYRNAEQHFRQAFTNDPSLLYGKLDLRELLSTDRLNYLLDDLGRTANANKADPGPMLLLAFVYYNTNLPDRAARALELAQQRAGGNDPTVKLLMENWQLPAKQNDSK